MALAKICYVVTLSETIEAFFVPQLRYLDENGFDVTCVCSNAERLRDQFHGSGVRCIAVNIPRGVAFCGMARAFVLLVRLFRKEHFDIVQYSTPNASFCAAIASKWARTKFRIYHLMGFRYLGESGTKRAILMCFEKATCNASTHIECVSNSNLELGVSSGIFSQGKASVIWNGSSGGVDLRRFDYNKREEWRDETRISLGIADSDYVYGFVGRITRDKGVNELLAAYKELDIGNCKLLLIGDYESRESLDPDLLKWAAEEKNVIHCGNVKAIEKYYPAIDVLVLPSYREGFGNVIIEAAAMGVPSIVSDIPGPIDAIKPNETAIVVEPKNCNDLVEAMKRAAGFDRTTMADKCHRFVSERFDAATLCKKICEHKMFLLGVNDSVQSE